MDSGTERDALHYDVVVVGAGPAGLATAIRLKQLANEASLPVSVCVLEKGAEVGAHILSGAVLETRALDELLPDHARLGAPLGTEVEHDEFHFLSGPKSGFRLPNALVPGSIHNRGNRIVSLSELCRWLAERAEALGVDVLPGFAAVSMIYGESGAVEGVVTADRGISRAGERKAGFEPGVEVRAGQTVLAEGARGHLGRELIERFSLAAGRDPQHYGIGLKEIWEVSPERHRAGLVVHGAGWPVSSAIFGRTAAGGTAADTAATGGAASAGRASGGFFSYHFGDNLVSVGLIVDLNYSNPWLSPFDEFQRMKHHPLFSETLRSGRRIAYGARAIAKGGLNSLPKMSMPGALLVGCDAGTLNFAKIKGIHMAMKSGMLAAETIVEALQSGDVTGRDLSEYAERFDASWLRQELHTARNVGPALHRLGSYAGGALVFIEQMLFRGRVPWTLRDRVPDHEKLRPAAESLRIEYPEHDGVLSFDMASSVYLSGTNHGEDQPCHLTFDNPALPVDFNLPRYDAPEQRYCPAGVYEIVEADSGPRLQVNAQNCLHCKTCDIKDPRQNIVWVPPEDGGPAYSNM